MRTKITHLLFALLILFSTAVFSVQAVPADSNVVDELKAQVAALATIESKLEFLKTRSEGQSLETNAAIGDAIILSASENSRKEVARNVALILAGFKNNTKDTAKLAGLLTSGLPDDLAPLLAGSIAIGAATSDPDNLPQIAASVIVAKSSTIKNAGAIAQEITVFAPLNQGTSIATAIASKYSEYPKLAAQASSLAAGMTRAMLPKGPIEVTRPEIATTVAALTVLLPGSIDSNKEMITNIGKAVADLIHEQYPGMATTIVGITSASLKAAAGTSDIEAVLASFSETFKDSIDDPIIQQKLDKVVSDINAGISDKNIVSLEPSISSKPTPTPGFSINGPLPTDIQYRPGQTIGYASSTTYFTYGNLETPETNVLNR